MAGRLPPGLLPLWSDEDGLGDFTRVRQLLHEGHLAPIACISAMSNPMMRNAS
jgi:hypothetical protein